MVPNYEESINEQERATDSLERSEMQLSIDIDIRITMC